MKVEIGAASDSDLESVLAVLDEASAWLQSIGVGEQWPPSFSDEPETVDAWRSMVCDGQVFVSRLNGEVVGCFRLQQARSSATWSDHDAEAFNLNNLAIRRRVAGQGIAAQMLAWAVDYCRSLGLHELRLSCWAGNERLRRYYSDAGFKWRGDVDVEEPRESGGRSYAVSRFSRVAEQPG